MHQQLDIIHNGSTARSTILHVFMIELWLNAYLLHDSQSRFRRREGSVASGRKLSASG